MFGLFRKRENPDRERLRQDFARVMTKLGQAENLIQVAVGHSVNMANSMFTQRFGSVAAFRKLPKKKKIEYITALSRAEEAFAKEQPHTSVGFALFKMWVGAVTEDDEELIQEFSKGLESLSKKGDLGD